MPYHYSRKRPVATKKPAPKKKVAVKLQVKQLTKTQLKQIEEHSKEHSKAHINKMVKLMKMGHSFSKAHQMVSSNE